MDSKREPYIYNPVTESSGTRAFVHYFIDNYASLRSRMFGGTSSLDQLYKTGRKDSTQTYIGRAAHVSSSCNTLEDLWCARVDIVRACQRLSLLQRQIIGRMACLAQNEDQVAAALSLSRSSVLNIKAAAIRRIAAILDGEA